MDEAEDGSKQTQRVKNIKLEATVCLVQLDMSRICRANTFIYGTVTMHIWSQLSFLKRKLSGLTKSPRSVHMCILYIHSEDGDYNIMRINGRT